MRNDTANLQDASVLTSPPAASLVAPSTHPATPSAASLVVSSALPATHSAASLVAPSTLPATLSAASAASVRVPAVEQTAVIPNRKLGYRFFKRLFDILAGFFGLLLLSPVLLITAIAIFIDDPGPVLFFQDRNGLDGKVFKMWKFRSMYQNAPELR